MLSGGRNTCDDINWRKDTLEPQAVCGQGFLHLPASVSHRAAEERHSPASWAEDQAGTSLSGQGNACLGIAGPEGGSDPNPGRREPQLPAPPGCALDGEEEGGWPSVIRCSSWCWGVRASSGGPTRDRVQLVRRFDFKPVRGPLGLCFSHL